LSPALFSPYKCFADLKAHETRGKDYELDVLCRNGMQVVVIAPHGGGIEPETSKIANAIAGAEFSLYCYRGLKPVGNARLHITSHDFDEPECLALLAKHRSVLAIHGCAESGESVLLGGRDKVLMTDIAAALTLAGINAEMSGHDYPGEHPLNICNRGARGMGAQFELSRQFRGGDRLLLFVNTMRRVLAARQNAT